jgi:hypothetical protein
MEKEEFMVMLYSVLSVIESVESPQYPLVFLLRRILKTLVYSKCTKYRSVGV